MTTPKFPAEGCLYAIPLWTNGFGLSLITRGGRGKDTFTCIFNRKFDSLPDADNLPELSMHDVLINTRIYGPGISKRCWTLIGKLPKYCRDDWPLPFYKCVVHELLHDPEPSPGFVYVVRYDEFNEVIERREIPISEDREYDLPGYTGFIVIEKTLTLCLEEGLPWRIAEVSDYFEVFSKRD